ncbi:hypothetical protein EV356DRAFT_505992 [Viridothelium virens]|uniref:Nucleic acid-binding protein n=1 Tax=Viridothelium virens TaxID=1048519 RepID=A0A6A6HMH5_VIRVR|nr:hypothetical protein EV356DRAFT_505992 [Viridothelium virens]
MFRPIILQRFSALPLSTTRSFSASTRSNLARMTIVGRLGAEPERVNTSTGKDIIRYVIGSNSGSRENQKTSWFKVTSFDENEARVNHLLSLQKGTLLYVELDPTMQTFTTDQTGPDGEPLRRTSLSLAQRSYQVLQRPSSGQDASEDISAREE